MYHIVYPHYLKKIRNLVVTPHLTIFESFTHIINLAFEILLLAVWYSVLWLRLPELHFPHLQNGTHNSSQSCFKS